MIFNVIHELISDMTIHITTYDTCALNSFLKFPCEGES